jgi:hypothetical protein
MIDASRAKLLAKLVCCSETKVGDGNAETPVEAQHILGFEVPVVDAEGMAVLNSIEQLEEDMLDEEVIAEIAATMKDLGEKVSVAGVVHNNVRVIVLFDNAVKGDNVRVRGCKLMQGNFADVKMALAACLGLGLHQAFDGIRFRKG